MASLGKNAASGDRVDPAVRRRSLRNAYISAMVGWVSLVCLISAPLSLFAIKLGAGELTLGFLTFIIFSAGLYQPFSLAAIEKKGKKKVLNFGWGISFYSVIALIALPILASKYPDSHRMLLWAVLIIMAIRSYGEGIGGAGWFPLLQDNVPSRITGKFFARFRTYWQTIALLSTWLVAYLLGSESAWWKFTLIFAVGTTAKFFSNYTVAKMWENPPAKIEEKQRSIIDRVQSAFSFPPMRTYILFVMTFSFTAAMVGPFQIKMLNDLGYSNGFIISATSMLALGAIISLQFWGKLADRYGNRAVFSFTTIGLLFVTLGWILVDDNKFSYVYVFLLYLVGSILGSGSGIAQTRYMMHAVPKSRQDNLIIINTMASIAIALGPLVGGMFLHATEGISFSTGAVDINNYHLLFIISMLLYLVPHSMRKKFRIAKEPATSEVFAIVSRPLRQVAGTFVLVNRTKAKIASKLKKSGNTQ